MAVVGTSRRRGPVYGTLDQFRLASDGIYRERAAAGPNGNHQP